MTDEIQAKRAAEPFVPPHPGSSGMPRWDAAELPRAPRITARSWALLIGPGLVAAGAAIGGGEWLAGPLTTARYGGAILWLATVSILAQVFYNLEICRYTLYCGEPIFTGKFRILPGPLFWLVVYVFLDFGSIFPYLVANAATPLGAVILGEIPDVEKTYYVLGLAVTGKVFLRLLTYFAFLLALLPLVFGGKVYNSLKAVMSFKIAVVFGFLLFVGAFYSTPATWIDIFSGFFKFGSIPVLHPVAANAPATDNIFLAWWQGRSLAFDASMIGVLGALAAISGNGGLTNTALSGYARDQGWGMGKHVGAIPSIVGGRQFTLCHVGSVFPINAESIERFRKWYRFLLQDQLVVWLPACFVGVALPSMLSIQFLPRGFQAKSDWIAAGMTADGLRDAVGPRFGAAFWLMTLFCGFLVLLPAAVTTFDGALRRWVDLCWTGVPFVRRWDPHRIRWLYFGAVCGYAVIGFIALSFANPKQLLVWATTIYNAALGISCFHVLAVNLILLPRELRPNWFIRIGLIVGGIFFLALAVIALLNTLHYFDPVPNA